MKNTTGRFGKLLFRLALAVNVLVCIWSALCLAAAYISTVHVHNLAVLSLTIPFAIVANLLCIIAWLCSKRRKLVLLPIITMLICAKVFYPVYGLHFFGGQAHNAGEIKVMSWNAHGFGTYDDSLGAAHATQVLQFIKTESPDILCVPEYNIIKGDSMRPNTKSIMASGRYAYFKYNQDNTFGKDTGMGTAIFSRYPLDSFRAYPLDQKVSLIDNETTYLLQCDVRLPGGRPVRLFVVHLYSFGINEYDIDFIERLKRRKLKTVASADYDPDFVQELKRRHININDHFAVFLFKLNYAYERHALEADRIAVIKEASPYPVLVCGDFNDVPGSYTYTTIRGKCSDAFAEKGRWLGRTFNEIMPTLRIDHIFYDPSRMQVTGYNAPALTASDHRPVIATFSLLR